MHFYALEDAIPEAVIEKVSVCLNLPPVELRKLSVYQIFVLFLNILKRENELLLWLEQIKIWMQPELYAKVMELERNKRVNIEFLEDSVGR